MKMKKITSLIMLITGFLGLVTSIVLYIVPQGRVAYWSGWKLLGLSKSQWGDLHINLGFFFILAAILHIYFNWALITAYLKNKAKEFRLFTVEFNIALFLTLVVSLGTYFSVPPFSTIINFGESFKVAAEGKYGVPPYGYAELSSLKGFTRRIRIDLDTAMTALQKAGVSFVDEQQTILDIAKNNKITPEHVYNVIKSKEKTNDGAVDKGFPPKSCN
jgi:hypothetical protein